MGEGEFFRPLVTGEDEDWLTRWLDEFFASRYQRMVGIIERTVGDRSIAEDAVQEALLMATIKQDSFAAVDNRDGWVFVVARNKARNMAKKARRTSGEDYEGALEGRTHEDSDLPHIVDDLLARMPQKKREAFIFCSIEGYSSAEASGMTALAAPTIREYNRQVKAILLAELRAKRQEGSDGPRR